MIIAAYAGTGKTTFTQRVEGAVDLPIMPCKWILPPAEKTDAELEAEKGALYRLRNPLFPYNYLAEILKAEREFRFVLIPTDFEVIRCLREEYGRRILLCYPEENCREEYRARFVARGNSESFLELFVDGWDRFLKPVRDYGQGVHIVMEPGSYLTDLLQRFQKERQADMTQHAENETIQAIEGKIAELKKDLVLHLQRDNGYCFYPIRDLDDPAERDFLAQVGRMGFEEANCFPLIAPGKELTESAAAFSTENRDSVMAFLKDCPRFQPKDMKVRPNEKDALRRKRWEDAVRREQIIYHRDYDPGNYTDGGLLYFAHLPVSGVRQLVAEGLLNSQDRHGESPTVEEMLAFCSGEDEAIWFFHGFTVAPDRLDGRVALEGFESFAAPAPKRREEFLRFNCRGETEVMEDGACWCWYD